MGEHLWKIFRQTNTIPFGAGRINWKILHSLWEMKCLGYIKIFIASHSFPLFTFLIVSFFRGYFVICTMISYHFNTTLSSLWHQTKTNWFFLDEKLLESILKLYLWTKLLQKKFSSKKITKKLHHCHQRIKIHLNLIIEFLIHFVFKKKKMTKKWYRLMQNVLER